MTNTQSVQLSMKMEPDTGPEKILQFFKLFIDLCMAPGEPYNLTAQFDNLAIATS